MQCARITGLLPRKLQPSNRHARHIWPKGKAANALNAGGMAKAQLGGMKTLTRIRTALFISGCVFGATGCVVHTYPAYTVASGPAVVAGDETVVNEPPPPPETETIIASPGPDYIWIGGYWGWGGGHWQWQGGHWARPPHRGAVWAAPRYYYHGGRHVWIRGGWR